MFKDFRHNLPARGTKPSLTQEEIQQLFRKGELLKTAKLCRRMELELSGFQGAIEAGARKLFHSKRSGLVLTFIHNEGVAVGIEIFDLLKAMFEAKDFHGFLKQALRFQKHRGIEHEIDEAIQKLMEKKQIIEAESWKKKFRVLREFSKEKRNDPT
jgi:hypothetical protein